MISAVFEETIAPRLVSAVINERGIINFLDIPLPGS